jgi:hypothetical protein
MKQIHRLVKVGAGAGDHYIYSLTNFLPTIAVARQVSMSSFALFASVLLVYSLVVGAIRASIGETLALRNRTAGEVEDVLETLRHYVWLLIVFSALPALVLVAVSPLFLPGMGDWLWVAMILLALPFHLAHDVARVVLLANRRTTVVLSADLLWLGFTTFALISASWFDPLNSVTLLWSLGGVIACLVVVPPGLRRPSRPTAIWDRRYSLPSLSEYAMQPAVVQGSQLAAGLVGPASAVAALRGGAALFRPVQLALGAHRAMVIGGGQGGGARNRDVLRGGLIFGSLGSLAYGALLWIMPPWAGEALLGETWRFVELIILPFALSQVASQMTYATVTYLKAERRLRGIGSIRVLGVVSIPTGTLGGVLIGGTEGAAWGFCLGQCVGALWTFYRARRVTAI